MDPRFEVVVLIKVLSRGINDIAWFATTLLLIFDSRFVRYTVHNTVSSFVLNIMKMLSLILFHANIKAEKQPVSISTTLRYFWDGSIYYTFIFLQFLRSFVSNEKLLINQIFNSIIICCSLKPSFCPGILIVFLKKPFKLFKTVFYVLKTPGKRIALILSFDSDSGLKRFSRHWLDVFSCDTDILP